jgi:hypothetical protein
MIPARLVAYAAIIGAVFCSGLFAGYKFENGRFTAFKEQLAVEAAKQEAKTESVVKQNELITKGIRNEYEARIAALRQFYGSGVRLNASGGQVPAHALTAPRVDGFAADAILAGQCAETTQQLVSLQDWIKQQGNVQ